MHWVTMAILGAVLLFALYFTGVIPNFDNGCDEHVVKEIVSPDGVHTAAVVEQTCDIDGQASRTRAVAVYETDDGYGGDIFSDAAYITTFTSPILLVWLSNNRLSIDPQGQDMPVHRQTSWNGISLVYVP